MFSDNDNIKIKNDGKYYAEISDFTIRNKSIDFEITIFDMPYSHHIKINDMITFVKHYIKGNVGSVALVNSFYRFDNDLHFHICNINESTIYNLMNKKVEDLIKNKIVFSCTADIETDEYLFQRFIIYI